MNSRQAPEPPALEARDIYFSYAKARPLLKGVSLSAESGLITMVLGASGSGKTTLLKLAKGLLVPQQGSITVLGEPTARARRGKLDARVAYIPQHFGLVRNLTVLDNTLIGVLGQVGTWQSLFRRFPREYVQQAYQTLGALGIEHKATEKVHALSGGERQRVAIARALMQRPQLILADEFISQLDPVTSVEIMDVMRGIARRGLALVMTTHEMDIVTRYADRTVVLRDGEKVLDCPAREMRVDDLSLVLKL
ncbi:MAG: ATP-binding cassette domain-containing protein [Chloroflexi bacterium]|nr:ATP-binding cassette domain-containing protein [Chloroflexota bacterium]